MAVAFYSDDSEPINRKVIDSVENRRDKEDIEDFYEIDRCVEWIIKNNYSKIALQFPDNLLQDAADVALKLEGKTGKKIFILGDTSYGSCCVDEIAAEHASADAIIHYGHACLSPTQRLPVLFVFGKNSIDVQDVTDAIKKTFPDVSSPVIIIYEVIFSHAIGNILENLKDYQNLVVSELDIPNLEPKLNETSDSSFTTFSKCHRLITIPKPQDITNYNIFYIGFLEQTLMNLMFSLSHNKFYTYNPDKKLSQLETLDINRYLKKRYYYIEKTKDAKIIGILVGTLGVSKYLSIVSHLRELIKEAGKKSYTLVVGKLNTAKLANFSEIEVFVSVACPESSVIDCHEFYQPIISPYELEIALNQAREWTGDYVTDFSELLPGAAKHIPPCEIRRFEADMSLITGKMRSSEISLADETSNEKSALVSRDNMTVSEMHAQAAGEYLSQRIWQGLEQHLGETPVAEIVQGRKGIACAYNDENQNGQ